MAIYFLSSKSLRRKFSKVFTSKANLFVPPPERGGAEPISVREIRVEMELNFLEEPFFRLLAKVSVSWPLARLLGNFNPNMQALKHVLHSASTWGD